MDKNKFFSFSFFKLFKEKVHSSKNDLKSIREGVRRVKNINVCMNNRMKKKLNSYINDHYLSLFLSVFISSNYFILDLLDGNSFSVNSKAKRINRLYIDAKKYLVIG